MAPKKTTPKKTAKAKKEDLSDLLGKKSKPAKKSKAKVAPSKKPEKEDLSDLLGKPAKKSKAKKGGMTYEPLAPPKTPEPGGIWERRASKGKNLGRTCLICNKDLKYIGGRPPVICRGSNRCFRAYRNLYRHDYDKARAA